MIEIQTSARNYYPIVVSIYIYWSTFTLYVFQVTFITFLLSFLRK